MPSVPNTTTFSLQDVINVINPSTDDLACCFAEADPYLFDCWYFEIYCYQCGGNSSLLQFRNYGGTPTPIPIPTVTGAYWISR
jgi:hypothetical protein